MVHPDYLPTTKLRSRRFLYRALNEEEAKNFELGETGLDAKDKEAEESVEDILAGAAEESSKKKMKCQFISTTFYSTTALYYAECYGHNSGHKIVKIDLFKLAAGVKIIDRTGGKAESRLREENAKDKKTLEKAQEYAKTHDIVLSFSKKN